MLVLYKTVILIKMDLHQREMKIPNMDMFSFYITSSHTNEWDGASSFNCPSYQILK